MKYLIYACIVLLACLLTYCGTEHFREVPEPEIREVEKQVIKEKIVLKEVEVIKWKTEKGKIVYRTKFDTLATIDTVYIELAKCDSIVKLDSLIIAGQDTIIIGKDSLISICESDQAILKKDLKRQRRKNFFTQAGAGVAIILTILLIK